MNGELDDDALALCQELCTRAGMLFEDAEALVIPVVGLSAKELRNVVREARVITGRAAGLLAAAAIVLQE